MLSMTGPSSLQHRTRLFLVQGHMPLRVAAFPTISRTTNLVGTPKLTVVVVASRNKMLAPPLHCTVHTSNHSTARKQPQLLTLIAIPMSRLCFLRPYRPAAILLTQTCMSLDPEHFLSAVNIIIHCHRLLHILVIVNPDVPMLTVPRMTSSCPPLSPLTNKERPGEVARWYCHRYLH